MLKERTDRTLRRWRAVALLTAGLATGVIMMATPAAGHVGGTVSHLWSQHIRPKADQRYLLRPTGAQEYWVAGSTWHDEDGGSTLIYSQQSWCTDNGASGYLIQQLHLPQGATITGYRAGYVDDSGSGGSNGTAYLTKEALNGRGGAYDDITNVDLPNASGWTFANRTLPTPEVVDNKKYAYIFLYSTAGAAGACTAGVFYTPPGAPTRGQPALRADSTPDNMTNRP